MYDHGVIQLADNLALVDDVVGLLRFDDFCLFHCLNAHNGRVLLPASQFNLSEGP